MDTQTKKTQQSLTPDLALDRLREGNRRFVNNIKAHRNLLEQINETSTDQFPFAAILSCIDSRTSAELIFDQGLGDIFSIRIAGNILNDDILGSMEFACKIAGSKLIVVLGHTNCGAITGACDNIKLGHLTSLIEKIKPSIEYETETISERNSKNIKFIENVTINNVKLGVEGIRKRSAILSEMETENKIKIVGGIYDVETGKVNFLN
ncbi:MAG: carbonic anhydrase family protein [Bacteroidota bacterium]|nr:carbonic anhydrase family protein [Bacteroidota bacterium]